MAQTYTYQHILSMLQKYLPRQDEATFAANVCNLGTNLIWNSYDWRESLELLPPFYPVPGEQDHFPPTTSLPGDFHGLRKVVLIHASPPSFAARPLIVAKDLEETQIQDLPQAIAYEPSVLGWRIFPRVPLSICAPNYLIRGTYKKRAPSVTAGTLGSTLLFSDDEYMGVWVEVLLFAAKKLGGAPDAGEVTLNSGQMIYTGQLAKAKAAIEEMATNEGIQDGDPIIAPREGLAPGYSGNWFGPYY